VLPDAAREHAWSALWQRLLQPVPDGDPADDLDANTTHTDDEATAEDSAAA
jgi:hypothetical protein